jgi:hypothetical protein
VQSFVDSAEFSGTYAPIIRLYFAAFLRTPDYAGASGWRNALVGGTPLVSIAQNFTASAEFQARYGSLSNAAFVELLYSNVLERASDPSGLAFWVGELDSGRMSRGAVLSGFSESAEFKSRSTNKVRATMLYIGLLKRTPDQAGFDSWLTQLNNNLSYASAIGGFIASVEYRNRFLP